MTTAELVKDRLFKNEVTNIYNELIRFKTAPIVFNAATVDHGLLSGLSDDDHPQYLTEARADLLYDYTLPTATDSILGGVKIGSGLSIDGNGVVSATGIGIVSLIGDEIKIGQPTAYHYRVGTGVSGETFKMNVYNNTTSVNMNLQTTGGYVGIGDIIPTYKLHVFGTVGTTGTIRIDKSSDQLLIQSYDQVGKYWYLGTNIGTSGTNKDFTICESDSGNLFTIKQSNGYVGVSPFSPNWRLDVEGHVNAVSGFVTDSNMDGTGNASYHPYGLYANGSSNWIYGTVAFNNRVKDSGDTLLRIDFNTGIQYIDTINSRSIDYSAGQVLGSGYKIWKENNKYNLQIDNIFVRETFNATTFNVQKIRATNGDLIVSSGIKVDSGITYETDGRSYVSVAQVSENTLLSGDIIQSRTMNGMNIYTNTYIVADTSDVKVYLKSVTPVYINSDPSDQYHSLTNVTASSFSEPYPQVYNITLNPDEYVHSSSTFSVKKGYYEIGGYGTKSGGGIPSIYIVDSVGTIISTTYLLTDDSYSSYLYVNTEDSAARLVIKNTDSYSSSLSLWYIDLLDYTIEEKDLTNQDFVRLGNTTNTSRQGLIHITASDQNAPYIEVRDGITSTSYSQSQIKARMGKLTGLTFNSTAITGYGFYSSNAYLQGGIIANTGKIANWYINNTSLYSTSTAGGIFLNSTPSSITLYDIIGINRIKIKPDGLQSLETLIDSVDYSWNGTDLDYIDETYVLNSDDDILYSKYIQQYGSDNTYLESYISYQSGKNIDILNDKSYSLNFKLKITTDYTLPSDDTDETDLETYTNTLDGYYNISGTLYLYDANDDVLFQKDFNESRIPEIDYLNPVYIDIFINDFNSLITESSVYWVLDYTLSSFVRNKRTITVYQYLYGSYTPIYTYDSYINQEVTIKVELEDVSLKGSVGLTELSGDGFQSVWDTVKYFRISKEDDYFIQSAGKWEHVGDIKLPVISTAPTDTVDEGTMRIYQNSTTYRLYIYLNGGWRNVSLS